MKGTIKTFTSLLLSALFILTLSACSDGPTEEAGEKIDQLVEDAGNAVEDACEDVKDAADAKDKDC